MLLIYTAHIMDPYTGLDGLRDILIDDNGIIVKVEKHIDWASAKRRGNMLLIYTAHIMDPYTGLDGLRDILIDDNGIIVKVEKHIDWASAGSDVKMLDAKSMTVAPGYRSRRSARHFD